MKKQRKRDWKRQKLEKSSATIGGSATKSFNLFLNFLK